MMQNLNNPDKFEEFDKGRVLASIRLFPDQMLQAWTEIEKINLPSNFSSVNNIVISGMGGSALGGRIVDSLLVDRVRVPIEIFNSYNIPYYANHATLVLASSYSGDTEETVSSTKEALNKKCCIFGVTTGGKLADLLQKSDVPFYQFSPKANPSGQPRLGLGYSIGATLAILSKLNLIHLAKDEFYHLVTVSRSFVKEFDIDVDSSKNLSKRFSENLFSKAVMFISAEHLVGVTHAFKNQLNETSKVFSANFELPELNHHLMEGLKYPNKLHGVLLFAFIVSDLYPSRILERVELTKKVIEDNGHEIISYYPTSTAKILQIFETLVFGSFTSFYLAFLNGEDPTKIPYVDYFKNKLSK